MTTQELADLFASAQAPCIDWGGRPAYAVYEISPAPQDFVLEFPHSISSPPQGLALKVIGGRLVINGVRSTHMLIWCDTAPREVTVAIETEGGKEAQLKLWNIWRGKVGGDDVTHAWLRNAGMRVDQEGERLILRCSDGDGPVDFNDLEARLTIR